MIKEVHSKLHPFQASLCTLTYTHLTLRYVCTYIRLSVPLGCLIKQAEIIIHTILNMWETPGIEIDVILEDCDFHLFAEYCYCNSVQRGILIKSRVRSAI